MHVQGSYDVSAMCLRANDFFQICHCAELNKIVEATMPVNPYDDCKVTLRRLHGNGDLDIVRTSYTRHKANVIQREFHWRIFGQESCIVLFHINNLVKVYIYIEFYTV